MWAVLAMLLAQPVGSIRAGGALGAGDIGLSAYVSLQGERWLAEHFALGGRALYGEQATGFLDTRTRRSALAEAEILTGIASSAGRLVAGVGIGSGSVEERSSRFCLFTCAPPPPPVRSSPLVASLVGGVIGYREWLALSAMARLQLIDGGWDLVGEVGIGVAF